jgi:hypothetical protein
MTAECTTSGSVLPNVAFGAFGLTLPFFRQRGLLSLVLLPERHLGGQRRACLRPLTRHNCSQVTTVHSPSLNGFPRLVPTLLTFGFTRFSAWVWISTFPF